VGFFGVGFLGGCTQKTHCSFGGYVPGCLNPGLNCLLGQYWNYCVKSVASCIMCATYRVVLTWYFHLLFCLTACVEGYSFMSASANLYTDHSLCANYESCYCQCKLQRNLPKCAIFVEVECSYQNVIKNREAVVLTCLSYAFFFPALNLWTVTTLQNFNL